MSLLPGYEHQRLRGIDSDIGQISKKDGLVIRYDIGGMAGNRALSVSRETRAPLVWSKIINVDGEDLRIVYFTDGKLIATFERQYANFFAHTGKLDEVEDFLVMIMTYVGNENPPAITRPQPFPEELIRHKRGDSWKARPPGDMSLLEGYEHLKHWGIDTSVGSIFKKDGLSIRYDIGDMGGAILRQQHSSDGRPWYREVKVNGDTFLLTWKQEGNVVATFVNSYANFFAEVKTPEDLIDFILMVMTYHSYIKPDDRTKDKKP